MTSAAPFRTSTLPRMFRLSSGQVIGRREWKQATVAASTPARARS